MPGERVRKCRVSGSTPDLLTQNLHPNQFPQVTHVLLEFQRRSLKPLSQAGACRSFATHARKAVLKLFKSSPRESHGGWALMVEESLTCSRCAEIAYVSQADCWSPKFLAGCGEVGGSHNLEAVTRGGVILIKGAENRMTR